MGHNDFLHMYELDKEQDFCFCLRATGDCCAYLSVKEHSPNPLIMPLLCWSNLEKKILRRSPKKISSNLIVFEGLILKIKDLLLICSQNLLLKHSSLLLSESNIFQKDISLCS